MCVLGAVFAASQVSWGVSRFQGIPSLKQSHLIEGFPQTKEPEGYSEWLNAGPLSVQQRERARAV